MEHLIFLDLSAYLAVRFKLIFVKHGQIHHKLPADQGFHVAIGLLVNTEKETNVF